MQTHRQRLGQCGFRQAQVVGNRVGLVTLDDDLLGKRALDVRKGHGAAVKTHVQAVVVLARLAKAAVAAGARGRNGDALALGHTAHTRAHTLDHARDLVPQCNGLLDAHGAKAAVLVVMQVRAANAAIGHIHAQLVFAQSGQFGVFDAQVFGRMADNGFHGLFPYKQCSKGGGHAAVHIQNMTVHKA